MAGMGVGCARAAAVGRPVAGRVTERRPLSVQVRERADGPCAVRTAGVTGRASVHWKVAGLKCFVRFGTGWQDPPGSECGGGGPPGPRPETRRLWETGRGRGKAGGGGGEEETQPEPGRWDLEAGSPWGRGAVRTSQEPQRLTAVI